jgi:phospholipid/cholesterol/gamma-HCH transport system ATP-binding protein
VSDTPPFIAFRGVHKRFGDHIVLDGVDIEARRGETLAILGPSGGGKTVLLKALVGLTTVDAGEIRFGDLDLRRGQRQLREARARIGFVFQESALFDSISVAENVGYALHLRQQESRQEIAARVAACLALVGLPGAEPLRPAELSGGMRKRVAVARALATHPELLLYDEPTAGLDPPNVRRIARLINSLHNDLQATSVVVTHDRELAFAVADHIALLDQGRIAWRGDNAAAQRMPPPLARFLGGAGASEP